MRSIARALVVVGLLAASPAIAQEKLIAIDVLIEPDQRMLGEAAKWNGVAAPAIAARASV